MITVTPKQALTVVRALLLGKPEQFMADATGLPVRVVRQLGEQYGAPDKAKLEWARDELEEKLAGEIRAGLPVGGAQLASVPPAAGDGYGQLLAAAAKSPRAQTRALAERVGKDLERLRERVEHESAEAERRRQIERDKAKAKADVARLERELAEAKARLIGRKSPAKPSTPGAAGDHNPKEVREWARDNGVDCPDKGRVPGRVVDAWREAQRRGAA